MSGKYPFRLIVNHLKSSHRHLGRRRAILESELDLTPAKVTWSKVHGDYTVVCERGRFWSEEKSWHYRKRSIAIRIIRGGICCGIAKLIEWKDVIGAGDPDEFWFEADAYSHEEAEFGTVVSELWDEFSWPFDYGTVANFERIIINTKYDIGRQCWSLLAAATKKELKPRCSAILFQVFPLEYSGLGAEFPKQLERRRKVLMDRFRTEFGAVPFSGHYGKEGWMWLALNYCPNPR